MRHPGEFASTTGQDIVTFANFSANLDTGELTKDGVPVSLQRQPFEVLKVLIQANGRLVTRDALANALWPGGITVDFERGLTNAVFKVREALGDSGQSPRYIETLPGRGYRFVCPVSRPMTAAEIAVVHEAAPPNRGGPSRAAVAMMLGLAAGIAASTMADRRVSSVPTPVRPPVAAIESQAVAPRAATSAQPSAKSAWAAGVELMATGRERELRAAMHWFDRATAIDPSFADAYASGAAARFELMSRGFTGGAMKETTMALARRALALDPQSARAKVTVAQLRMQAGALDEAAVLAEQALRDDPSHIDAYATLACIRKQQGRFVEAAALADAALTRAPGDALVVARAGFFAHPAGRFDREKELLDRAEAMAPASIDVLWHVALGEARRADYIGALSTLDRALMLAPNAPRLLYWKGFVEAEAGRTREAQRTLDALRQVSRSNDAGADAVLSLQGIVEHTGR